MAPYLNPYPARQIMLGQFLPHPIAASFANGETTMDPEAIAKIIYAALEGTVDVNIDALAEKAANALGAQVHSTSTDWDNEGAEKVHRFTAKFSEVLGTVLANPPAAPAPDVA